MIAMESPLFWIANDKDTAELLAKHLEIDAGGEDPTGFVQFAAEQALKELQTNRELERHNKQMKKIKGQEQ